MLQKDASLKSNLYGPLIIGMFTFLLYAVTGAKDILWGDPAKLMGFVHQGKFYFHQEGHVGHVFLSWIFSLLPIDPYYFRMHLSSAVFMGIASGIGTATLLSSGISLWAAWIGMAAVVVAHTVWFTGAMFESYPMVLMILSASLWLLIVAKRCFFAGLLIGIGVAVHPICLFGVPAFIYRIWKSDLRTKGVIMILLGVALGSLVLVIPTLASLIQNNSGGTNWMSAMARYGDLTFPKKNIPLLIGYAFYNFSSPALLLIVLGTVKLKKTEGIALLLFTIPHYFFAIFWLPQRSYLVPLPVYFLFAYLIARGAEGLILKKPSLKMVLLISVLVFPILTYIISPPIISRLGLDRFVRDIPYRNETPYFLQPWKFGETSTRDYLTALEKAIPQKSILMGDWTLFMTLKSAQRIEKWRQDLMIIQPSKQTCGLIDDFLAKGRRIYLLDVEPGYYHDCLYDFGEFVPVTEVESLTELIPNHKRRHTEYRDE